MAKKNSTLIDTNFIRPFVLLVLLVNMLGCTRKKDDSTKISISIPSQLTESSSGAMVAQSLSAQTLATATSTWNTAFEPTAVSEINCFAVMVGGPESGLSSNRCYADAGKALPVMSFGPWVGAVRSGTSLSVDVPSGSGRTIYLVGFKVPEPSLYCKDFKINEPSKSNMSAPRIIARATLNLQSGTTTVNLTPSLANSTVFEECDFASQWGGGANSSSIYGDGSDGDLNINTSTTQELTQLASPSAAKAGVKLTSISRVKAMMPGPGLNTLNVQVKSPWNSSGTTNLVVGDQVMLYIAGQGLNGSCGGNLFPGFSTYGKVNSIVDVNASGTTFQMSVNDPRWLTIPAASPGASGLAGTAFCRVVAVRVPQLNSLTVAASLSTAGIVSNTGISFGSMSDVVNTSADHKAGLFVMKIAGRLQVNPTTVFTIDETGKGYQGGNINSLAGDGYGGASGIIDASTNSNGGAGSNGSLGFAGSHASVGGGATYSGLLAGDQYGCGENSISADMRCLFGKFFFGGGGGSTVTASLAGGNGGGLIRLMANTIELTGSGSGFVLKSKGGDGNTGTYSSSSGAGGSVFLQTSNFISATGTNFIVDITGGSGGQSGGAGRFHMNSSVPASINGFLVYPPTGLSCLVQGAVSASTTVVPTNCSAIP